MRNHVSFSANKTMQGSLLQILIPELLEYEHKKPYLAKRER
ncbi:hypothetical protein A464_4289 [Salmonella bongori N268-08]|uniref:Uncharacterized protein n=1 Tax=Salmonella bongori N268-08 TaxID=1197719 RepID=S5MXR8_SALBN|nr:hypothetical protein A464_4289 [Salmonella bongori N268-08]